MKKNFLYLLMLVCSLGVFTSCSSDDDDPVVYPIDKDIAGNYIGDLSVVIDGYQVGTTENQKITIAKSTKGDNQVALSLKDFTFIFNVGDITVDPCTVKAIDGGYAFEGSQTLDLIAPIGSAPVTISGTVKNGKINILITVGVKALNQNVEATFDGHKMTGNESSEAFIKTFSFDSAVVTVPPTIDNETGNITFSVKEGTTAEELTLTPVFTISDNAVVTPASGVQQDFSKGNKVTYTLTAADGTKKVYNVYVNAETTAMTFPFEEWVNVPGNDWSNEYDKPEPTSFFATSNEGASMLKIFGVKEMPVTKTNDKKNGNYAIKLVTMDTSVQATALVPAITSGSLFSGTFDITAAMTDKLASTKFGMSYNKKPLTFSGWYKYAPGTKFIDGSDVSNIVEIAGKTDEFALQAVLFVVDNDKDVLTGHDINSSTKRVAVAAITDGSAKAEYTHFELPFTWLSGKTYDATAKYKIAIVCSSSKEGDAFKGAGGSTLILDDLEILGE